jgi:hypothetical protein
MTGVVTGQQENGFMFQTKEGEIPCNLPEGMEGMGVGEAFFAIAEIPAGNDITMITGFEPLEDTIETIGSNMKNMGSNSLLKPEQVAVRMVNELGAMTQNVPEQTKTWLQAKLGETIETSMPDEAWMNMNREAVQNMNAEGAGFIPPAAFGQMPVDVFGQMELEAFSEIPVNAFGVMSTEAFQNMPDGAFDVMKPEAFGQIPSDVKAIMAGKGPLKDVPTDLVNTDPDLFYQMADQAFHDFWIKHDVPLGEDGLPVPTYPELPGNPGAPTPGEPGAGAPPQGTGGPGSGGTGTPTDPNNPPAGENPEQPGQPQQPQQPTEQQPGNPPPPPPPPPAPPSPPGP